MLVVCTAQNRAVHIALLWDLCT